MDDTYSSQQRHSQVRPRQWMHLTGDSLVDHSIAPVARGDCEQVKTHIQVAEALTGLVAIVARLNAKDRYLPQYALRCLIFPVLPQP